MKKFLFLIPYSLFLVCGFAANASVADEIFAIADKVRAMNFDFDAEFAEWQWQEFTTLEELMDEFPTSVIEYSEVRLDFDREEDEIGMHPDCPTYLTVQECDIWLTRPHVRETVANEPRNLRPDRLDELVRLVRSGVQIDGDNPAAAALVNRYRLLKTATRACCRDGMVHRLRRAGADEGLVYKFVFDDANFYMFGQRCLMTSDADLDNNFPNMRAAEVMADVRNTCLCKSRGWFQSLLAPFIQLYNAAPEFADQRFSYAYQDGLQRTITVSINRDVQNVLFQLGSCP